MLQTAVFGIVAALVLPSMGMAGTFTSFGGFSSLTNPTPSGWSYGTETTLGGALTLLPYFNHESNGFDSWQQDASTNVPDVQKNLNPGAFGVGTEAFCPAACVEGGGNDVVFRWTNNTTDTEAQITATFTGFYDGTTPFGHGSQFGYLLINNQLIASGSFTNVGTNHGSITLTDSTVLAPGDQIDFVLGQGRVVVDATIITSTPEPAAWVLMATLLIAVGLRRFALRQGVNGATTGERTSADYFSTHRAGRDKCQGLLHR